jgi:hypothetical protein
MAIGVYVILLVGYQVLPILGQSIGIRLYAVSLFVLLVVIIPSWIWWCVRKTFPAGGIGATTERVIPVPYPFERVCKAAVGAMQDCAWKVTETNPEGGYLKCKVGRTLKTPYGQLLTIDVKRVDEVSTKVSIVCSALYAMMDFGGNDDSIQKFNNWLVIRLSTTQ